MPHKSRHYRRASAAVVALLLAIPAAAAGQGDEAAPAQWQSDGFDTSNLGTAGWSVVSTAGRGLATVENSTLRLRASGDIAADTWRRHDSLHLSRPAPNTNFVLRTTFGTVPTAAYEAQGLVFSNNEFDFLRIDVIGSTDGETRRLYAASSTRSQPIVHANELVEVTVPYDMQIRRDGDLWTVFIVNAAGEANLVTSFVHPMIVKSYGPFVTSRFAQGQASFINIEVVESAGEPVIPNAIDQIRPLLQGEVADNIGDGIAFAWTTDEATEGIVRVWSEDEIVSDLTSPLAHDHRVVFDSAVVNTVYEFDVISTDASGNQSSGRIENHIYAPPEFPIIEIYGGRDRTFGLTGDPQPTASITGIVRSPTGSYDVRWRLDRGEWTDLIPNPASTRVIDPGEFSIELEQNRISSTGTTMEIEARETGVAETITADDGTETLEITPGAANSVLLDLELLGSQDFGPDKTVFWGEEDLDTLAQIANGGWKQVPGGITPLEVGPQRIILIGDQSWSDYEVEFAFVPGAVVPAVDPEPVLPWAGVYLGWRGFDPVSAASNEILRTAGGVGFGQGDGGITVAGVRNETEFISNTGVITMVPGVRYRMRASAQTVRDGAEVRLKLWIDGDPEPDNWTVEHLNVGARSGGSLALVAHRWDIVFESITIRPIEG
ncbi:MAG: hypothetical protein ACI9C1_000094 [Candidatus Aldehydirespiratoraceae bacterium]